MSSRVDGEETRRVRAARPRWGGAILVCGKCLKRHRDGKEVRRAIKEDIKLHAAAGQKKRKARIVKIACIGLCPKGAVVVGSAATLAAGEFLLVEDPKDIAKAFPRLLPRETEL